MGPSVIITLVLLILAVLAGVERAWQLTLVLAALAVASSTRTATTWGLRLLWFVQKEPAASDLLFAGAILRKLLSGLPAKKLWRLHPFSFLAAFLVISSVQVVQAVDPTRALLFNLTSIYVLAIITYMFWFKNIFFGESWKRSLELSIIVTAALMIALWLTKQAGIVEPFRFFFDGTRPRAFFKDPNVAAPFIIFWALRVLSQFLLGKDWQRRHWLLFGILVLGATLSFSRGALINLFVGVAFLVLVALRRKRLIHISLLAMLLTAVSIAALLISLNVGQQRFLKVNDYDLGGRMAAWKSGLITLKRHPWGVGPGQFEFYSIKVQTEELGNPFITPSAHNMYLRVLVENGLSGFVFLVVAFLLTLAGLLRSLYLNKNRALEVELAWCLAALLGILAEGFFIDVLHWRHLGIALGLSYYFSEKAAEANAPASVQPTYHTSPSSKPS